ncbi:MAG: ABC transporter permease [Alphaproteobacteria bacterium]
MLKKLEQFKQSDFWYSFSKDKVAFVSGIIVLFLFINAFLAPLIAPHNPYDLETLDIMNSQLPPAWNEDEGTMEFLLGTDAQGRDMLSTILYGMRTSLIIGFCAVAFQMVLGITLGLIAGYRGGRVDNFLMRIADIQLSFSTMMVAIIVLAIFQSIFGMEMYSKLAMFILIVVIGIAEWPKFARTVRSSVLAEKEKEYVEAAKVMGISTKRIMFLHILPNCLSPILVIATVQIAEAIITEASLSFLGLGMPVVKPSLGSLISSGFEYIFSGAWWITAIPGLVLVVLVLAVNLLGDWLRDYFNPKIYKD